MPDERVDGQRLPRPHRGARRWTSFVADTDPSAAPVRGLHEQNHPEHRVRVEHDAHTLLIHLSDEGDSGWTTIAIDRATRRWAVAQDRRQTTTAQSAYDQLYQP